jgi:flagellar L-ring protein precursor FlgH
MLRRLFIAALPLLLAACSLVPPEPVVLGPTTAIPPAPAMAVGMPTGSIFQHGAYGSYPLFEDPRPRNVGDVVTIVLEERTNAVKNVNTNTDRSGNSNSGAVTTGLSILGTMADKVSGGVAAGAGAGANGNNFNTFSGQGASSANNTFSGTITTTVVGVLPNGNLQVAGEKQIAINRGSEYVKFSGVVDPRSITGNNNSVSSTRVADARIEYRSRGTMDEVQNMGWLQRFFLIASPY